MSAFSGLGGKGEKNKSKYTTIKINDLYKGSSSSSQKTNASSGRHGLQSLGKVGGARRMPPPANLPSLRSENSGNDPTVSLVPTGGTGWGAEKSEGAGAAVSGQQSAAPMPSQQSQAGTQSSPVQGQIQTRPITTHSTQGAHSVTAGLGNQQGVAPPRGTEGNTTDRGAQGAAVGLRSWSGIAGAGKKRGIVDQNSPFFREEFPTLASGGDEKSGDQPTKKEGESKESQYGPGPSLRPQNVASWREGGSRAPLQQPMPGEAQPAPPSPDSDAGESPQLGPPAGMGPPPGQGGPRLPGPGHMGPGGAMMPPFRMPPHFMYRPGPGYPGFPPNFHPGMRHPGPYPGPFPDQRFRGPGPRGPPPNRRPGENENNPYVAPVSIIKDQDLKGFDELDKDGGWAGAQGEIDYSEKLVFSDDEDMQDSSDKKGESGSSMEERKRDKSRESEKMHDDGESRGRPPHSRDSWMAPTGPGAHYARPPMDWQGRMPFDGRPPMPGYPPQGRFRMPGPGQRPPFPYTDHPGRPDDRSYRPEDRERRTSEKEYVRTTSRGDDEDDLEYQRMKKKEEKCEAVERARVRREEEEQKITASKAAAREKLKMLEERLAERRKGEAKDKDEGDEVSAPEVLEHSERPRTISAGSDKDKQYKETKVGKTGQKIPPRMQRQLQEQGGPKPGEHPPQHPGMRGGPPPPWAYNPYGTMPWPGMPIPAQIRRQMSDSGDSEGRDDRHTPDMPPYDPRSMWPYGPPPPGWEDALRRGAQPNPYYGYNAEYERGRDPDRTKSEYEDVEYADDKAGSRDVNTRSRDDKSRDAGTRSRDEKGRSRDERSAPREADTAPRRAPRESDTDRSSTSDKDKSMEKKVSQLQLDGVDDGVKESWGEWPDQGDDSYGWGEDSGDVREDKPVKTAKPPRRENSEEPESTSDTKRTSSNKDKRGDKHSSDRRSSKESRDEKRRDDKKHRRDDRYDDGGDKRRTQRQDSSGRDRDNVWGAQAFGRGERRKGPGAPVPIPSQMARENIGNTRSNFTSLKRSHSNSAVPSVDRKSESPKESLPKTMEEKPHRVSSKESLKEGRNKENTKEPSQSKPVQQPPSVWTQPKTAPAAESKGSTLQNLTSLSSDVTKTSLSKSSSVTTPTESKPRANVWEARSEQMAKRDTREDTSKSPDKQSMGEDKPPSKKSREDRSSTSSFKGARRDEERSASELRERGARTSTRGRSGALEYVRGGRGRGRSSYPVRGGLGRGRGRGEKEYRSADREYKTEHKFSYSGKSRENERGSRSSRDLKDESSDEVSEPTDARRRAPGEDSDEISLDENSGTVSEVSVDKQESRENSLPKQPEPLTSRWSDVARDKSQEATGSAAGQQTQADAPVQQSAPTAQQATGPVPLMSLNPLADKKEEDKPQLPLDFDDRQNRRGRGGRSERGERRPPRGRRDDTRRDDYREDTRRDDYRDDTRRDDYRREDSRDGEREQRSSRGGFGQPGEGRGGFGGPGEGRGGFGGPGEGRGGFGASRERYGDFGPPGEGKFRSDREPRRGRGGSASSSRGRGSRRYNGEVHEDQMHEGGYGGRGRGRFNSAPGRGSFGRPGSRSSGPYGDERGDDRRGVRKERGRPDRNQPPRFSRGAPGGRGRGERDTRGGMSSRGRGSSAPDNTKPVLNNQSSLDLGNECEEWETASESSDVLTKSDMPSSREESKENINKYTNHEKKEVKKSFSSQRPNTNERQNRRDRNQANDRSTPENRHSKERSPTDRLNNGQARNGSANGRDKPASSKKENVNISVFRLDEIEHADPTAVQNALNNAVKTGMKNSDLSDVSKPLRAEKEKKNALADIDMNNYASVVVIDDQPEVSIDDPQFFFESNEGFQEVCSKKTAKSKRTVAETAANQAKIEQVLQTVLQQQVKQIKAKEALSVAKATKGKKAGHGVTTAEQKRLNKLPPRLAKVKAEALKERKHLKTKPPHPMDGAGDAGASQDGGEKSSFMKIENWDNAMAKSIPSQADTSVNRGMGSMGQFSMGDMAGMIPASIPPTNAWDKPINLNLTPTAVHMAADSHKYPHDKGSGDQHDSGIDVSEALNSAASSTRSSPNSGSKVKGPVPQAHLLGKMPAKSEPIGQFIASKPQRQPSVPKDGRPEVRGQIASKVVSTKTAEASILKKAEPKPTKSTTVEPIQLPASFKDAFKYKGLDSSDIKLDFTFDAELAKLSEAQLSSHEEICEPPNPMPLPGNSHLSSAHDTNNLGLKIASVKKVWDQYGDEIASQLSNSTASVSVNDATQVNVSVSQQPGAPNFNNQQPSSAFSNPQQPAFNNSPQPVSAFANSQQPSAAFASTQPPQEYGNTQDFAKNEYGNAQDFGKQEYGNAQEFGNSQANVGGLSTQQPSSTFSANSQQAASPFNSQHNTGYTHQPQLFNNSQQTSSEFSGVQQSAFNVPQSAAGFSNTQEPVATFTNFSSSLQQQDSNEQSHSTMSQSSNAVEVSVSFAASQNQNTFNPSSVEFRPSNIELPNPDTIREFHPSASLSFSKNGVEFNSVTGAFEKVSPRENVDYSAMRENIDYSTVRENVNYSTLRDNVDYTAAVRDNAVDYAAAVRDNAIDYAASADMARFSSGTIEYSDPKNEFRGHPLVTMEFANNPMLIDNIARTSSGLSTDLGYGAHQAPHITSRATAFKPTTKHSNVCEVKPQQQFMQTVTHDDPSPGTQLQGTAVSSPPTPQAMILTAPQAGQYHPFQLAPQMMSQEPRNLFSLTQPPPQAAQQPPQVTPNQQPGNVFLPYRRFGQAAQPNTIMVSSTSSLMTSSIKPPPATQNQSQFMTSHAAPQNSTALPNLGYGGYGNQFFVQVDPIQPPSINTNQPPPNQPPSGPPHSAASSSSGASGPLLHGQPRVQGLPPLQVPPPTAQQSSFASHQSQQSLQQTGFYQAQQSSFGIPGPTVQPMNALQALTIQGFGGLGGLGVQLQPQSVAPQAINPLTGSTSQLNKSAPPFKPAAQKQAELSASSSSLTLTSPTQNPTWGSTHLNMPSLPGAGTSIQSSRPQHDTSLPPPIQQTQAPSHSKDALVTSMHFTQPPPLQQQQQKYKPSIGSLSQSANLHGSSSLSNLQKFTQAPIQPPFLSQRQMPTAASVLQHQLQQLIGIRPSIPPPQHQNKPYHQSNRSSSAPLGAATQPNRLGTGASLPQASVQQGRSSGVRAHQEQSSHTIGVAGSTRKAEQAKQRKDAVKAVQDFLSGGGSTDKPARSDSTKDESAAKTDVQDVTKQRQDNKDKSE